MLFERPAAGHRAILVHVHFPDALDDVEEFRELVTSAQLEILHVATMRRERAHPRWFLGTGKVDELTDEVQQTRADLVIFNHELSPGQQRNLEEHIKVRVMTRTELILHIFADRARTHEGQLQVELAQLTHAQTRMVRGWTHLDRQKGGVNLRGAGETQLEMDQRMLAEQVRRVRGRLASVHRQRTQSRRGRSRAHLPTVALAGYTNAGKSTLFNALTTSHVHAADQMFATLDPTMRRVELMPGAHCVLADTVGFIRALPVTLVDAFKATLEEIVEADLVLHVIDAANPACDEQRDEVTRVLGEIGAAEVPVLEVMNKADLLTECIPPNSANRVHVSALTGTGIETLKTTIAQRLSLASIAREVHLRPQDGRLRSWLYEHATVDRESVQEDGTMHLEVRMDKVHARQFERMERATG